MPTDTEDGRGESIENGDPAQVEVEIELDGDEWAAIREHAERQRELDDEFGGERSDEEIARDSINDHMALVPIPIVDGERRRVTELVEDADE